MSATGVANPARGSRLPNVCTSANGGTRSAAPAGGGRLGLQQDLSEFTQRFLCGQRSQEQPARAENATNLDERAREVVHPMQRQRRQDRIKGLGGERKELVVPDDGFGGCGDRAGGVRGEDCQVIDSGMAVDCSDLRAVTGTQQEARLRRMLKFVEPLQERPGRSTEQVGRFHACAARQASPHRPSVEELRDLGRGGRRATSGTHAGMHPFVTARCRTRA